MSGVSLEGFGLPTHKECPQCHKKLAPGMFWVHQENHEKGRILTKPRIAWYKNYNGFNGGAWVCYNGSGQTRGVGADPAEAYFAWRTALDY